MKSKKMKIDRIKWSIRYLRLIIAFYNNSVTETKCILSISSLYFECVLVVLSVGDAEKYIFRDVIKLYGLSHSAWVGMHF